MWALEETNTRSRKNNSPWDNKESFYIYTLVHRSTNCYHWLLQALEKKYSPDYTKKFYREKISMLRKSDALAKGTDYSLSIFVI